MRIAILAPFGYWTSAYSLCHVVADQIRALVKKGHEVRVWCGHGVTKENTPQIFHDVFPTFEPELLLQEFGKDTDLASVGAYAQNLRSLYATYNPDILICHDIALQSAYSGIYAALRFVDISKSLCFHYLHSRPTAGLPSLPKGHFVLYPNSSKSAIDRVSGVLNCEPARVFSCSNPRDPSTTWRVNQEVSDFVDRYDALDCDVMQVYPVCTTRMEAKGVEHVVKVFDEMKTQGLNVLLVLANSNGQGLREKEQIQRIRSLAKHLTEEDLVFTSELPGRELGVPHSFIVELMRFSNVFIFPTVSEVGPLVLLEAALNGCICAVNSGMCPDLIAYTPPGSVGFHLPVFSQIEGLSVTMQNVTVRGEEAYQLTVKSIVRKVLDLLHCSYAHSAKRMAFRIGSLDAHAASLQTAFDCARTLRDNL